MVLLIVMIVHSHGSLHMYDGYLWSRDLQNCWDLCTGVIFSYYILLKLCTCDKRLHSLYLAHIVVLVIRFILNIILQFK